MDIAFIGTVSCLYPFLEVVVIIYILAHNAPTAMAFRDRNKYIIANISYTDDNDFYYHTDFDLVGVYNKDKSEDGYRANNN